MRGGGRRYCSVRTPDERPACHDAPVSDRPHVLLVDLPDEMTARLSERGFDVD
jgi:hypothetical protein